MPHEQRSQTNELGNEENKGKNDESKERMTKNFADNIAVQDAHDKSAECSTSAAPAWRRRAR
jgi:hypothetical protein